MPEAKERPSRVLALSLGFAFLGLATGIAATATSLPLVADRKLIAAWTAALVPSLAVVLVATRTSKQRGSVIGASFFPLLIGAAGLGPGSVMLVNRYGSEATQRTERHRVVVVDHGKQTKKGQTTYSVSVSPFPPLDEPLELDVEASVYERCTQRERQPGVLEVREGSLGMPFVVMWGFPAFDCPP
jgi:hypothetical protein